MDRARVNAKASPRRSFFYRRVWLIPVLLVAVVLGSALVPGATPMARADYAPPPAPKVCAGGVPKNYDGISIMTDGVQEYYPSMDYTCLFAPAGLSESTQIVKPGQQITFTSTDSKVWWDNQTPHYLITKPYIQLGRLVGVSGAAGGNIDGYRGQPVSTEDGETGWAQIVSGCQSGNSTCTIQIPPDPVNGDGNGGASTQTPAFHLDEWYTVDDIYGGPSGYPSEIAFYLETGQPTALFTYSAKDKPGEYAFTDSSLPGYGNKLTKWAWDFGDGSVSSVQNPDHTFAKPGTYPVSLTVTDSSGATDTVTHSITIKAPSLSVDISFPGAPGGIPQPNPGDSFPAVVTVAASAGLGDLSNLSFTGDALNISPQANLNVTSGPSPSIFSLSPSSERTFKYQLQAKALGTVQLFSQVTGIDANNASVSAQGTASFTIGHPLQVVVTPTPNKLQLKNAGDGSEIAQPESVQVKVTNVSTKTLDNVQLTTVEGVRGETADLDIPVICDQPTSANKAGNCAVGADGKPSPGSQLGALAPGASGTVTYKFKAQGDGTGEIDAIAAGVDPDSPTSKLQGFGAGIVKVLPTAILYLNLQTAGGGSDLGTIKPNQTAGFGGFLQNVSNSYKVDLEPLEPQIQGNAGDGNPVDLTTDPEYTAGDFPYPINGEMDPGDKDTLTGTVAPSPDMSKLIPMGTLTYEPQGTVTPPDGSDRQLTASDSIIAPKGGKLILHVDGTVPPPDPASLATKVWYFTKGFFVGAAGWTANMICAVPALVYAVGSFLVKAPVDLLEYLNYLVSTWKFMKAQGTADQFVTKVAVDAANHTDMKVNQIVTAISDWLDSMEAAWNSGDSRTIAEVAGKVTANVVLEAALWALTGGVGNEAKGAATVAEETQTLAELNQGQTLAKRISGGVSRLKPGDNLLEIVDKVKNLSIVNRTFGISNQELQVALEAAKKMSVYIGIRLRNPLSLDLLDKLKAVVKFENFKIKSVSDIDQEFLGYAKTITVDGVTADSESAVILKQPISESELLNNLEGQPYDIKQAAIERWLDRKAEWQHYLDCVNGSPECDPLFYNFKKWNKDGYVSVGFDNEINGVSKSPHAFGARKFQMQPISESAHGTPDQWLLKVGDIPGANGILRPMAGDIDVVAFWKAGYKPVNAADRAKLYEWMAQSPFGMAHGEETSFLKYGMRNKLFSAHNPNGGEAIMVVCPDGKVLAGYIDQNLTVFGKSTGQPLRIWVSGAPEAPAGVQLGSPPTSVPNGPW